MGNWIGKQYAVDGKRPTDCIVNLNLQLKARLHLGLFVIVGLPTNNPKSPNDV